MGPFTARLNQTERQEWAGRLKSWVDRWLAEPTMDLDVEIQTTFGIHKFVKRDRIYGPYVANEADGSAELTVRIKPIGSIPALPPESEAAA